ncbi:hypothetical protein, partial [Alistipes putredinis]|uniref:hypothetical protein n=1 Tax=Alistipes putredinis TaxID=28117 RepID=UPI003AB1EE87
MRLRNLYRSVAGFVGQMQIAARLFEMQAVTAFRVGNGASEDRGVARFENADRTIRNRSGFRIENTAPDNEA